MPADLKCFSDLKLNKALHTNMYIESMKKTYKQKTVSGCGQLTIAHTTYWGNRKFAPPPQGRVEAKFVPTSE